MCLSAPPHPLFPPSSRQSPGAPPSPSRKARVLLASIPPSTPTPHPPPATCLAGPFPSLGLEVWQGFQGSNRMAELVRLTESGPQHQAARAAPRWPYLSRWPGRPHRLLCSLWQESSESTNTTIEDEDTKGRGGLACGVWAPGASGRPPSLTAPGPEGPQHQPCVLLLHREPRFGFFQTGYTSGA